MLIVSIILQILLGIFFTPEGVIKWTRIGPSTARFEHFRYPRWFKYLTGVCELLIGLGLLVGLWFPLLATLAAALLSIEMLVAIYSHLVRGKDKLSEILPAVVFLVLALVILALPQETFCSASVIVEYANGGRTWYSRGTCKRIPARWDSLVCSVAYFWLGVLRRWE